MIRIPFASLAAAAFFAGVVAVVSFAGSSTPASAYSLTGFHYDHHAITYACDYAFPLGDAVREWAAVSAIEDGGCTDTNPDIVLVTLDPWPIAPALAAAGPSKLKSSTVIEECTVYAPANFNPTLGVFVHEVGHCLGFGHSSENLSEPDPVLRHAAMFFVCCNPLNADDIAAAAAVYGPGGNTPTPTAPFFPTLTPTATPTPQVYRRTLPQVAKDGHLLP